MNKTLLTGGAIVAVCAVIGYTALGYATKSDAENTVGKSSAPAGVQVADASGDVTVAAVEENPEEAFAGMTTETGAFTGDVVEGSDDATVTIIEYASLTCPHCAAFHEEIYLPMKPDYIDNGKVKFIYRDFPLDNFALSASMIARCGGETKYLGFIDLFMEKQDKWRNADNVVDELKKMARLGGLGSDQIDACISDQVLGQSVLDRARVGQDVFDVSSTPTVLINGEKFRAASLKAMKEKLDSVLGE